MEENGEESARAKTDAERLKFPREFDLSTVTTTSFIWRTENKEKISVLPRASEKLLALLN